MIHIIKNNKWVITTSLVCILFGVLTFFTFINQSFVELNDFNLQILLIVDLFFLVLFFTLIIKETYKILKERRKKRLGSETTLRYITFFTTTTLLPSIIIAIFSLILFNVGVQKYFDKKIKTVVNNSSEVAKNYLEQAKSSIESDILLMMIDVNSKPGLFYDNPRRFQGLLASQRMLRKLDEVHLLDSSGNIIMSNIVDPTLEFIPPTEEALTLSLDGKPVRTTDPKTNRTSALIKLSNFIDTYLYIVRFMDPKLINYLTETDAAVSFYYVVQDRQTGIKITFAIIYVLIVSLLLFLSVVVSINFASRLTKPIINLIGASEKISKGDLYSKVPNVETDREFEMLNANFNSMIEKLKKQQDKLLISERHSAWENVARKLAHEIKNPLTPIQLTIDNLKSKYTDQLDQEKKEKFIFNLKTILKQIKQIENLVNEFSDFARMPKPLFKKNNLYDILIYNIELLKKINKEIKFDFKFSNKNIIYYCDYEQISRVFLNLIKNSIESIIEKSKNTSNLSKIINIEIIERRDYININISDTGTGFGKIETKNLIKPYYTTKQKGSGLGLSIVNKIINDHNGSIKFLNHENGAKIEILLPNKNVS